MKSVLVTGAAGFIGSHTMVALAQSGFQPVGVDNFSNSRRSAIENARKVSNSNFPFYEVDLEDGAALKAVFDRHEFSLVIHFAGLKSVFDSVRNPLQYYRRNLFSTASLLEAMGRHAGCKRIIFSSSATVYGEPQELPIRESHSLSATNPYGRTKLFQEEILRDLAVSDSEWKIIILRYFNPVGAHPSALIGEDPGGRPNNLFPVIGRILTGKSTELSVYGGDFATRDGTGMRDYIHVCDLAGGHVSAAHVIDQVIEPRVYNLGTGRAYSVLEVIREFERCSGRPVPFQIVARRPGDVAACYASVECVERDLGWKTRRDLPEMTQDAVRWFTKAE